MSGVSGKLVGSYIFLGYWNLSQAFLFNNKVVILKVQHPGTTCIRVSWKLGKCTFPGAPRHPKPDCQGGSFPTGALYTPP